MKINRSDKPDYSLVRDWLRRELYNSIEYKKWVIIKLISKEQKNYAIKVTKTLRQEGFRVILDDSDEKIGYKIREAQIQKIPYMLVIGEKEVSENKVSVRDRKDGDIGQVNVEDFIIRVKDEIKTKAK